MVEAEGVVQPHVRGLVVNIDPEHIVVKALPVFAGYTPEGEKIVLYKKGSEIHIMRPDGEVWALSPGSEVEWVNHFSATEPDRVRIVSPEWTGTAIQDENLLIETPSRP